jgi:hypothetical protein
MKKLFLLLGLFVITLPVIAQLADTSQPFYKRFPTVTPFQILLSDSSTMFTRKDLSQKPVVFIVFSPECEHCQHEAEEIYAHKDSLKEIQIVMITMHPFAAMQDFIGHYKLNEVPEVVVGRDIYYLMPSFYKFHNLPFHAMYNKEGNLLGVFEGSMNVSNLIAMLKEKKQTQNFRSSKPKVSSASSFKPTYLLPSQRK